MLRRFHAPLFGAALLLVACERNPPADQDPPPNGVDSTTLNALIAGTPPGDIEQWIQDMRSGLDSVKAVISTNRPESHRRLLELYVTRQEYVEMYYGPSGRMSPQPELSTAVKLNETRFHEAMRLTGATPPASQESINQALSALDAQMGLVLENASRTANRVRGAAGARDRTP
jgi:hypothetical protein